MLLEINIHVQPILTVLGWGVMIVAGIASFLLFLQAIAATKFGGRSGAKEAKRGFLALIVFLVVFYFLFGVNISW